jgi:SEC-C motif
METPEHERRAIKEYLSSQFGPDFEVEHAEKLTSEYVLGHEYDVWDARTNEGRWWVITNPTYFYSQELIKSMDVALSFHIGLTSRMTARVSQGRVNRDNRVRELLRRLDAANESLDRAKEVEDFQAVGMRLRELLLTLTAKLSELELEPLSRTDTPKKADFKAWSNIYAESIASGPASQHLRALLKATSTETWDYVNWLTHARNASKQDADIAVSATHQVIESFLLALTRVQQGDPERCTVCTSYRLQLVRTEDGNWVELCETCGSASAVDTPVADDRAAEHHEEREAPQGDCVEVEDFGIYLTPGQIRSIVENAVDGAPATSVDADGDQPNWTNPFAFFFWEAATLADVHRVVFMTFKHPPYPGSELIYPCAEDACVNPQHAVQLALSNEGGWQTGIVEQVTLHPAFLELQISIAGAARCRVFAKSDILDRYGLGDASSLLERSVFVTSPSAEGWIRLIPAVRRVDLSKGSSIEGWRHPPIKVKGNAPCPCGSGRRYSTCHGHRVRGGTPRKSPGDTTRTPAPGRVGM